MNNILKLAEILKKYETEQIINLIKLFNETQLQILKKLNIIIQDKLYTKYEFDIIQMELSVYYIDQDNTADIENKLLEEKGVSRAEYNIIINKFDEIELAI